MSPTPFRSTPGVSPAPSPSRCRRALAELLQHAHSGRLCVPGRPSPAARSVLHAARGPGPARWNYYESVGQNWERAAFIKARAAAGDLPGAEAFLESSQPFIWRRNLDFAAIADIHSIKRQIHVHKVDDRLTAPKARI